MIELVTRVLCDSIADAAVEAAYLFSQTVDNQSSVLDAGAHLMQRGSVERLMIWGSEAQVGYPGSSLWRAELAERGVPSTSIDLVGEGDGRPLNTLTESEGVVEYARAEGLKRVVVVAPPFHQVRAFVTAVSVALRAYPTLDLYSFPGRPLSWNETVIHSQGVLRDRRAALISAEVERIHRYREKGDLVSPSVVLDYLDRREGGVQS